MELSIIFVNWNSVDCLRECIRSIYQYTSGIPYEIIVVDNASPMPGVDALASEFPAIRLNKSDKNLGFAGANNLGYRESSGENLLFLNPDTKLLGPSVNILLERLKDLPDAGIVGCKLLNSDCTVQSSSIQRFPTILNQAIDAEYLRLRWPRCRLWSIAPLFSDRAGVLPVDVIPGACMLIRRSVFEQVGLFSEEYFMYAEDLDLNYKLKRAGFRNYYVGETAIIHHGGRSSSRQKVSQWATVMKCKAMLRLFTKTRGRAYAAGYRLVMGCVAIGRIGLLGILRMAASGDAGSWEFSLEKWKAVLYWAIGRGDLAVQSQ